MMMMTRLLLILATATLSRAVDPWRPAETLTEWDTVISDNGGHFKGKADSVPSNSDQVCGTDYRHKYQHIVYVDPGSTTNRDCDFEHFTSQPSVTCSHLNTALSFHANSTAYVLASGANITHYLKQDTGDSSSFFEGLSHVGLFGYNISEVARIECLDNAGLAFWNTNQVRLQRIVFSHCGTLRKSTSKDFSKPDFRLIQISVALYFYNGSDVTMCHVTVRDGVDTLGVMMYDINGKVNVYHSNFDNNTISSDFTRPGGGGFGVEFSYCVPGDQECATTRNQSTHNTNSNYTFYRTSFIGNAARAAGANRLLTSSRVHEGLGRGGGMAVYFKGDATGNSFRITACKFVENRALWGGGLLVEFDDTSLGNSVVIEETLFLNNSCYERTGIGGGALRILSLLYFELGPTFDESVQGNKVTVNGYFFSNEAKNGGAISYSPAYQQRFPLQETTMVRIVDCVFSENKALLGAAIHMEVYPLFVYGLLNSVVIENSNFTFNVAQYAPESSNYDIGIGVVYSFQVPIQFLSEVNFSNNYGSALAVVSTHASFHNSSVFFVSNQGDTGGAIAFLEASQAIVNENTYMYFENNVARVGGAIYDYMTTQGVIQSNIACFIRYHSPLVDRENWQANFTFVNNTAIGYSNSIYSTSVYPCARRNIEDNLELVETLLFCINPYWVFVDSNCSDQIETKGNIYRFQNKSALTSFPGQGLRLPISVSDDLNHNVTDSVGYTSSVSAQGSKNNSATAQVDPKFTLTSGNFLSITGLPNSTVHLQLQSSGSRPHHLKVDVELLECPPGFFFNTPQPTTNSQAGTDSQGKCECKPPYSFRGNLNCSIQNFESQIPWYLWIGMDPTGEREGQLVMSNIPNIYSEQDYRNEDYYVLPKSYEQLDQYICGTRNRAGPICGRCKENYSTSVNSYDYRCTSCGDDTNFAKNILIFMASAYLPYIFLLGAVVYFNLKFTSSSTSGFILYAQMMSLDIFTVSRNSRIGVDNIHMHKAYLFVYGLFNFNSFANVMEPFCIGKNFTSFDVLLLEYTLAALPLLLIVFLYFLLRCKSVKCLCCRKQQLSIQASLSLPVSRSTKRKKRKKDKSTVHAFVAFILLSYTKLSLVSMKMITTVKLFDENGNNLRDSRLYLAGHMSFFSREYLLPYGLITFCVVVFFVFFPPLFLLGLPQLVDRLLEKERFSCLRRVWPTVIIHIYLDAFQGFYKPNRRFFAGLYLVFRLAILIVYISTSNYLIMYTQQQLFIVVMIILLGVFKPYKREVFNIVDILIFLNLAVINLISTYVYSSSLTISRLGDKTVSALYATQYCLLWFPLIYMLSYLVFKQLVNLGIYQRIAKRLQKHRGDSQQGPLYFTDNSEMGKGSGTVDDEGDLNSLSDAALFRRARDTNTFRPPSRQGMHSVLDERDQMSSEFDTESTENGTNSTG